MKAPCCAIENILLPLVLKAETPMAAHSGQHFKTTSVRCMLPFAVVKPVQKLGFLTPEPTGQRWRELQSEQRVPLWACQWAHRWVHR